MIEKIIDLSIRNKFMVILMTLFVVAVDMGSFMNYLNQKRKMLRMINILLVN